jgi:hypothetical protein
LLPERPVLVPSAALTMFVPMQVFRKRVLMPGLLDAEVAIFST